MVIDKPILGEDIYLDPLFANGLVGCWLFNEDSGNKVFDLSGNGNNGNVIGATWIPGKFGPALYFIDNDLVDVSSLDAWVYGRTSISFGIWFRFTESQTGKAIMGWWYNFNCIIKVTNNNIEFVMNANDSQTLTSPLTYNDNLWHFVYVTYDASGGSNNQKLYIDGVVIASTTNTGSISSQDRFNIGSTNDDTSDTWNFTGDLDLPGIYNRALSASEIAQLYSDPFWGFRKKESGIYTRI